MTTHRKMITFPELGAELLERAAPGKGRAQGDYLTAVLRQRVEALEASLMQLRQLCGISDADLADALARFTGVDLSPLIYRQQAIGKMVLGDLGRQIASDLPTALAFWVVLQEYNAGNKALTAALKGYEI